MNGDWFICQFQHRDVAPGVAVGGVKIPGGDVFGTWDASGSPYLIDGDITIPTGATLTIEPGVDVLFQSWYSLTVNTPPRAGSAFALLMRLTAAA